MAKLAFVTSFFDHISVPLQQMLDVETMSVGEMIDKWRVLRQSVEATVLTVRSGIKRQTDRKQRQQESEQSE